MLMFHIEPAHARQSSKLVLTLLSLNRSLQCSMVNVQCNMYVATIGMFDGVHRGHQFVLQQVVDEAHRRGLLSMAITFDKQTPSMLTPLDEKRQLLAHAGIDHVEVLTFDDALRQMTARQFMQEVLKDRLNVKVLLTGYDNRFGYNRVEGFDDYVRYGQEMGIDVISLPVAPTAEKDQVVSSSLIRELLLSGQVAEAAQCMGHLYSLQGCVAHGEHIGTTMGFPTANIEPNYSQQLIPAPGAYAVLVSLDEHSEPLQGMMNIGMRPTFNGQQTTLEVYILHFNENLYGRQLSVSFVERLRDEKRFATMKALKEQLQRDVLQTEEILNKNKIK